MRGIAAAAFRLRTGSGLAYAPTGRHQPTTFAVAVSWPRHGSNEHGRCVRLAADLRVRRHDGLKSNDAIRSREFAPRDL